MNGQPRSRFPLGRIVITTNAFNRLDPCEVQEGLRRHMAGDWGKVCMEDAQLNEQALADGDRIHSAYQAADGTRYWIITEADRSLTTILLPDDY